MESSKSPVIRKMSSKVQRKESLAGFLFVSPMLIGVSILILFPIIATFLLSFVDWKFVVGLEQMQWVGFDNFKLIFSDQVFVKSLINNALFILSVPICMIISLFLAVIIDQHVYLKSFFKVAFFMPYISSVVAVAVVWQVLFHPSAGPINQVLMSFGIENPPLWIADPNFALISVMLIHIWISVGFNLIVYIAGLQSIPKELYEAADIDGANLSQFGQRTPSELSYGTLAPTIQEVVNARWFKKPPLFLCSNTMLTLSFNDIILVEKDGNHCYENKIG